MVDAYHEARNIRKRELTFVLFFGIDSSKLLFSEEFGTQKQKQKNGIGLTVMSQFVFLLESGFM